MLTACVCQNRQLLLCASVPHYAVVAAPTAAYALPRKQTQEARERLRRDAVDSVNAARSRVRRSASESIAEAQARIAAEDAAALAEVHKVKGGGQAGRRCGLLGAISRSQCAVSNIPAASCFVGASGD